MRRVPSRASSLATSLLTADGVIPTLRAADEKPPRSTTCTKTSISPDRLTSARAIWSLISQMLFPPAIYITKAGSPISSPSGGASRFHFSRKEDQMEYRSLGRSGLKVSVLSFGAGTFGGQVPFSVLGARPMSPRQGDLSISALKQALICSIPQMSTRTVHRRRCWVQRWKVVARPC